MNTTSDISTVTAITWTDTFDAKMTGNCASNSNFGSKNDWNMITRHASDFSQWYGRYKINFDSTGEARPHLFTFEMTFKQSSTKSYYLQIKGTASLKLTTKSKWLLSYLGPL
jgi:hypothetical protein